MVSIYDEYITWQSTTTNTFDEVVIWNISLSYFCLILKRNASACILIFSRDVVVVTKKFIVHPVPEWYIRKPNGKTLFFSTLLYGGKPHN